MLFAVLTNSTVETSKSVLAKHKNFECFELFLYLTQLTVHDCSWVVVLVS